MKKLGFRVFILALLMFILVGHAYIETQRTSLSKDASRDDTDAYPVLSISRNERSYNIMYPYTRCIPFITADSYTYFESNEVVEVILEDQPKTMLFQYEIMNPLNQEVLDTAYIRNKNIIQSGDHIRAQLVMPNLASKAYPYMLRLTYKRDGESLYYYQPFYIGDSQRIDYLYDTVMTIHNAALDKDEKTLNALLPKVERSQEGTFSAVSNWSNMDAVMWDFGKDILPMSEPKITINTIDPEHQQYEVALDYTVAVRKNYEFEYWDFTETYQLSGDKLIQVNHFIRQGMMNADKHKSTLQSIMAPGSAHTESLQSDNGRYHAFIRDREVWLLDGRRESYSKIFGFDILNSDYIIDNYNQHRIKLLDINDSGILTYVVYGYMNTGLNRGKNGIALYQYNAITGDNEEAAFIHMPYGLDKMEKELSRYITVTEDLRMLQLLSDGAYYQVNLKEGLVNLISDQLPYDTRKIYVTDNQSALFWEKDTHPRINQQVDGLIVDKYIIQQRVESREEVSNHILGTYNNQIVVGYYHMKDTMEKLDGTMTYLYHALVFLDDKGQVIDELKAPIGRFYHDIQWQDNKIAYSVIRKKKDIRSSPTRSKVLLQEIVRQDYLFDEVKTPPGPSQQMKGYVLDERMVKDIRKTLYIELIFDNKNTKEGYELIEQGHYSGSYDTLTDALLATDKHKQSTILKKEEGRYTIMYAGKKPESIHIAGVPVIPQKPELPRGCEVTSLSMLLNFYLDDNVDKLQLADEVKKDPAPYEVKDGVIYFGNAHYGFVGDMANANNKGYGVYHEPIAQLANHYMPGKVLDITGSDFEHVLHYVGRGYPVWVISPNIYQQVPDASIHQWETSHGVVEMSYTQHAVLIIGYDKGYVYFNDPSKNMVLKRRLEAFKAGWESFGHQAVFIY